MTTFVRLRLPLAVLLFAAAAGVLGAQSPDRELWRNFLGRPAVVPVIPEDEELGLLADLRNPDPAWASTISVCEAVFGLLAEGTMPKEHFSPDLEVPLVHAFETVLETGRVEVYRRYGRPVRSGDRVDVPVRLASGETVGYGHIYLVRLDGEWLVEQWAVDLIPFAAGPEEETPAE